MVCASAIGIAGLVRIEGFRPRFGIRNFKVKLRKAASHLEKLRGPEGELLPPNTLAELLRHIARLRMIREQIRAIEIARLQHLKGAPHQGTHPMMQMLHRRAWIMGIGIETAPAQHRTPSSVRAGARETSCADFGVGVWDFNPKPE